MNWPFAVTSRALGCDRLKINQCYNKKGFKRGDESAYFKHFNDTYHNDPQFLQADWDTMGDETV